MKVIGAGMPRTGTLTQKMALELLGLGPCYHMVDVLADLDQADLWQQTLAGEPQWEQIFDGFQSTVDWPGGYFYEELADFYRKQRCCSACETRSSGSRACARPSGRYATASRSRGSSPAPMPT